MKIRFLAAIAFLCVSLFLSFYFLKNTEYIPKDAIAVSNHFLRLLITKKLKEAYSLTNENAIVGTSYERFQKKVDQELRNRDGMGNCDLSIKSYGPKQTFGNRLKRYWNQDTVEVDPLYVEYYPCELPFQIALHLNRNGEWKIVNFQSHAD
ncbi:hypothetical protein [Leptospira interrogans]|uniref:hypothetical protein n=1 Tax=Leptospira interrogans TaxID=173 RepID=UPI0002BB1696|nr:hypothetical protein [Leptospira interrogans]EMN68674.1 hypothetical protein LEP1GSC098_0469 [Leptospira interrogans serovar Grippotyphosa str. UI 08434]